MTKRILSIILSIVLIASCCYAGFHAYAENKTIDVNKELLESLLNDRYWVIETLAEGDLSNNPYREAAMIPNQTLMEDVLENYQENEAFKVLVDAMEIYANTGEYVSGFADSVIATFMEWFGLDTSEGVLVLADDIISSTSELKYESILNEVLITDYTSTWGETLYEENMDLEYMKQLGSLLRKLPKYQSALKDAVGLHGTSDSAVIVYDPCNEIQADFEIGIDDYVDHFLTAYEQDLEAALVNAIDIPGLEGNEALKKKILAAGYLGMLYAYEKVVLPEIEIDLDDYYYDGMFESTMQIMKGAGKVMKLSSKTMDYAILMESLYSQKTSLVETMGRIEANTTDEDLAKVFDYYATLVENQGDANILGYEVITDYLRNEQVITNFLTKKVTDGAPKLLESAVYKYGGAKSIVLHNRITSSLSKAGAVVKLAVWVADVTTGIKDTAKKIYVLKYLDKIITEAEKTFDIDMQIYLNDKTEENAAVVLNDLEFLKELRLYGEKTAYGSTSGQMTSWLGLLLGGGETAEFIDYRYQGMIDTFLGSTLTPISKNKLVLSKGDVLEILTDEFTENPEKVYTYACWKKASGETVYFAEPELRCFAGVDLNGATLKVFKADEGFYLPVVDNDTNGAVIELYCNDVAFGNIYNSAEMTIYQKKNGVSYDVTERITNSGTLNLIGFENSANINTYEYDNRGTINITDTELNLISTGRNNGTITGMVNICGGNAYYENAYYTIEKQVLFGTGTYSHLNFINSSKKGVTVKGKATVTDYICNSSTRLHTSENITVTGVCTIANNYFKGGLGFGDYSTNNSFTLDGSALIYNNVTFGGSVIINDSLKLTSKCQTLTLNGETLVKGDLLYEAGAIAGSGKLSLRGDAKITASSPTISYLDFVGSNQQSFSSSNKLTVAKLNNSNTSLSGVTFNSKIYVTDILYSGINSAYGNGQNVILTGEAKLDGNQINGNISAENWTCTNSVIIKGMLCIQGEVTIAEDCELSAWDFLHSSGAVTNNGTLKVNGDSVIKGTITGGTFISKGDVSASAELTPQKLVFESKVAQVFNNSSTTTVENLTINNSSKSGFVANSKITVTNCFNDISKKIVNGKNIVLSGDAIYVTEGVTKTDLALSGTFTVSEGETLTVNGDLTLNSGATLIIEPGATVLVKESMIIDNSTLNSDGNITIVEDVLLKSSTINATGLITFMGDLNTSSCTFNNPNICLGGKVGQTVSGSAINVNNLIVSNTSKSGVTFNSKVNYYGEYDSGASVIHGSSNVIDK